MNPRQTAGDHNWLETLIGFIQIRLPKLIKNAFKSKAGISSAKEFLRHTREKSLEFLESRTIFKSFE